MKSIAHRQSLRRALALSSAGCVLLGTAGSAHASTFSDLASARAGDLVTLTTGVNLRVATNARVGETRALTGALDVRGTRGVGVQGTLRNGQLTFRKGSFKVARSLSNRVHTIAAGNPFVARFDGNGQVASFAGTLTSTRTLVRANNANDVQGGVEKLIPPPASDESHRISVRLNGEVDPASELFNRWDIEVNLIRNGADRGVIIRGATFGNTFAGQPQWRYKLQVEYPARFWGQTAVIRGELSGSNLFQPPPIAGLSGTVNEPITFGDEIPYGPGLTFTGGRASWTSGGLSLSGGMRLTCARSGALNGTMDIAYASSSNWKMDLKSATDTDCVLDRDVVMTSSVVNGAVTSVNGLLGGRMDLVGPMKTSVLPPTIGTWDSRLTVFFGGGRRDHKLTATSALGRVDGTLDPETGTFKLGADFRAEVGGSMVPFTGEIVRPSAGAPVQYDVFSPPSVVTIDNNATVTNRWRMSRTGLKAAGVVTIKCPDGGTVSGEVDGTVPQSSAQDWEMRISPGTGSNGCRVSDEINLGNAESKLTGVVKSVGGVVSIDAVANQTINTKLIPTKSSLNLNIGFNVARGSLDVKLTIGSTPGVTIGGGITLTGGLFLDFAITDLKLGNATVSLNGSIGRQSRGGPLVYSGGGTLTGPVKLYNRLFLQRGAVNISSVGGLTFSGELRWNCTAGYLDASVSGTIVNSRTWSLAAKGIASECLVGNAAVFRGDLFSASVSTSEGRLSFTANVSVAQVNLIKADLKIGFLNFGGVSTWMENVSATITNTCSGCYERDATRISFKLRTYLGYKGPLGITGNCASFRVVGSADIIGFKEIEGLDWDFQKIKVLGFPLIDLNILKGRVSGDTIEGLIKKIGSGGGGGSTKPQSPWGVGTPLTGIGLGC